MLIVGGVAALVTGTVSYFAFKPSATHNEKTAFESAGSIKNNVTIEEKTDVIALYTIALLIILVMLKFIELGIVAVGTLKRAMKKKYSRPSFPIALSTITAQNPHPPAAANPAVE